MKREKRKTQLKKAKLWNFPGPKQRENEDPHLKLIMFLKIFNIFSETKHRFRDLNYWERTLDRQEPVFAVRERRPKLLSFQVGGSK